MLTAHSATGDTDAIGFDLAARKIGAAKNVANRTYAVMSGQAREIILLASTLHPLYFLLKLGA